MCVDLCRSPRRGRSRSRSLSPRSSRSRSPREDRRRNRSRTPLNGTTRYNDASGSAPSHGGKDSQQERRVYVGNLSYEVKWPQLKDYMRSGMSPHPTPVLCFWDGRLYMCVAGEVIHAEVLMLPNGMSKVGLW